VPPGAILELTGTFIENIGSTSGAANCQIVMLIRAPAGTVVVFGLYETLPNVEKSRILVGFVIVSCVPTGTSTEAPNLQGKFKLLAEALAGIAEPRKISEVIRYLRILCLLSMLRFLNSDGKNLIGIADSMRI
jgi:hypothetical protein